jgi:anti-sigma28 factor (negative regulator of flagellin synthesis)
MRIQGPRQPGVNRSDAAERDAKTSKAETKGDNAGVEGKKGDVVSLGSSARTLSAGSASSLGPEIRARLDMVRQQLQDNEYAVDYRKLASNILGDEIARSGEAE